MLERSRWSGAAVAVAAALLSIPAGVVAQGTVFRPGGDGRCEAPSDVTFCTTAGGACGPTSTCRSSPSGGLACVPDDGFVCCRSDADCYRGADGIFTICISVPGIMSEGGGTETGLCLEDRPWCDVDGDGSLSVEEVITNLTSEGGRAASWDRGDADRDGLANGREVDLVTNPCAVPAKRGFWDGSGCVAIPTGCDPLGEACTLPGGTGTCQLTEDAHGTECAHDLYSVAWCGGPTFECVAAQIEDANDGPGTSRSWCVPLDCVEAPIDLADCVLHEGTPGAFGDGDCDDDGVDNGADESLCGGDAPIDGGVGDADGGANPIDAGGDFDGGGERADAGLDVQPTFGGGGGCRCRAGASHGGHGLFGATVLLGLALARRRRR